MAINLLFINKAQESAQPSIAAAHAETKMKTFKNTQLTHIRTQDQEWVLEIDFGDGLEVIRMDLDNARNLGLALLQRCANAEATEMLFQGLTRKVTGDGTPLETAEAAVSQFVQELWGTTNSENP